ncbi:EAL domain-containing protein [Heyndrickxia acidiproducens]|uniref:EAL domain-containing protein n=1 Tax=Heyndrickxia acidiproducens TaxID=1121084 RepID=UPI0003625B8D|nr:EAL domain-containing protein [Heyndrickxia acidiproducens]
MNREKPTDQEKYPIDQLDRLFYRESLHQLADIVSVIQIEQGPAFRFIFVNETGAGKIETGRFIHEALPQETARQFENSCKAVLESGAPVNFIHKQMSSGRLFIYHTQLSGIRGGDHKIQWMIAITRDVTGVCLLSGNLSADFESQPHLSMHEPLTGLWNRHALMEHLKQKIEEAKALQSQFAVLYIDLDRFKYFNDILGQHVGDEILKRTARRLEQLPLTDYKVYRQGGDEFIVLSANCSRPQAEQDAARILSAFYEPFRIGREDYFLTPSIGISVYPDDGSDEETLIKHADTALFNVKESGKGHFRFYSQRMERDFQNYILMEAHLRRAIEKNELSIHYQAQVHLNTGRIKSFEALLRWQNPKFGNVPPLKFIPLAEETGLIIPIGEWIINQVCAQIAEWRKKGRSDIKVAVNISPRQFQDPNLPAIIGQTLKKYQLPPAVLEIEITESAMEDRGKILAVLRKLKEMGLTIAVDDFGTGYSSLNYIKKFPIDILKIDQSFVRELQISPKDVAITKTIIHLAHHLGLEVIAEGVEEKEQVQFLQSVRCQKAQGYFFSRPITAEEVEKHFLF